MVFTFHISTIDGKKVPPRRRKQPSDSMLEIFRLNAACLVAHLILFSFVFLYGHKCEALRAIGDPCDLELCSTA